MGIYSLSFYINSSNHIFVDRIVFYVKTHSDINWNGDLSILKDYVIGTTLGWSYGEAFDQIKSTLHIYTVNDICTNFKKLMVGRVDMVPTTYRNGLACIEAFNLQNKVVMLSPDIQDINGYIGFSKQPKLSNFKRLFNARLKQMIDNGTVSLINNKYQLQY